MGETWIDDDNYHRAAITQRPSEAIAAELGYDHQGDRDRTFQKLRRAGLESFIVPCDFDLDKIVRYERLIKRNLYRALYTIERIQTARHHSQSSDAAPPSHSAELGREVIDENKF